MSTSTASHSLSAISSLQAQPKRPLPLTLFTVLALGLLMLWASTSVARPLLEQIPQGHPNTPRIVIIIDDIGDNRPLGQRAVELPGQVTLAFLPHTPNASQLATRAHQLGKEVMLHMPMSNLQQHALGPGGLTPDQDHQTFSQTLHQALSSIPFVSGINNHMGSDLTQRPKQMRWLMDELSCRNLYFVDSRTSATSVAYQQAEQASIDHLRRDIFLDHDRNPAAIAKAFERMLTIARRYGVAIGIGHPYPETLALLEQQLPKLDQQGIELVFPSQLLDIPVHQAPPGQAIKLALQP